MNPTTGIDLMRHALGVQSYVGGPRGRRFSKPYRNHFVAGWASVPAWEALVALGHARKTRDGDPLTGGMPCYAVTDEGQAVALAGITFKRRWGYATAVTL